MFHLINLQRVQQSMGELSVFDYVADAFLAQSSAWRTDFSLHTKVFDRMALAALVHKMKGSCQAVAAFGVAHEFELAERALPHMPLQEWPACAARLVLQLDFLEAEIRAIMRRDDAS